MNSEMSLSEQEREKSFAKTLPLFQALVDAKWALMSLHSFTGSRRLVSVTKSSLIGSLSLRPMMPATCSLRLRNRRVPAVSESRGGASDLSSIPSKSLIRK